MSSNSDSEATIFILFGLFLFGNLVFVKKDERCFEGFKQERTKWRFGDKWSNWEDDKDIFKNDIVCRGGK